MRPVGMFRELEPSSIPDLPSLIGSTGSLDEAIASRVAEYLDSGIPVLDAMEAVQDPLNPEVILPGGSSLVCDGYWYWRADLSYFVRQYGVALDEEFVAWSLASEVPDTPRDAEITQWIASILKERDARLD